MSGCLMGGWVFEKWVSDGWVFVEWVFDVSV